MADETTETPEVLRGRLVDEAKLVTELVTSALNVLHSTDAGVSLVGEFIGLVSVTGGVATSTISAADEDHRAELAEFFASRFEAAAHILRQLDTV